MKRSQPTAAVADRVRDIIAKELGVEREKLVDDAGAKMVDLGADSLDVIEIVIELEREFNIDIPDEDAEKMDRWTTAEIARYVEERVR